MVRRSSRTWSGQSARAAPGLLGINALVEVEPRPIPLLPFELVELLSADGAEFFELPVSALVPAIDQLHWVYQRIEIHRYYEVSAKYWGAERRNMIHARRAECPDSAMSC